MPVLSGLFLYGLTRRLKTYTPFDVMYFAVPYAYVNYGTFMVMQKHLYECGYPAHPLIQQMRTEVINKTCYKYPQIVKNEIEYIHAKLHNFEEEKSDATDSDTIDTKYEREFRTGHVTTDYARLLTKQAGVAVTKSVENEIDSGIEINKRFKIIVDEGEVYLQCIDSFEDVFQISRDVVEHLELTEILDPFIFESHKDIVNALFQVYYDLSQNYLQKCYYDLKDKDERLKQSDLK